MSVSSAGRGLRPGVVTSTTRPTTPYAGMVIYETDTGYLRVWDGSAWDYLSKSQDGTTNLPISDIGGAWTSYTPTWKGGATTITQTVNYAKYCQINKTVFLQISLTATGAGATNGRVICSYPSGLAPINNSYIRPLGGIVINDGGVFYTGNAVVYDSTNFAGASYNTNDYMGTVGPAFTIASGDRFEAQLVYEVA